MSVEPQKQNVQYALQMLQDAGHISAQAYDEQGRLLTTETVGWKDAYALQPEIVLQIRRECLRDSMPTLWAVTKTVFYAAILAPASVLYLLGPLAAHPVGREEQQEAAQQLNVESNALEVAHAYASTVALCSSAFSYLMTGFSHSTDSIMAMNTLFGDIYIPQWITYHMKMEEHKRSSYEQEKAWLQSIRQGTAVYDHNYIERQQERMNDIGKLAESDYKQEEYQYVSGLTLAARAAIEGGVAPEVSFELSDAGMQELACCTTVAEMRQVYLRNMRAMNSLVRRARADRSNAGLVTRCKLYVDEMMYEHINVQSIAAALQVSPNHLSAAFVRSEDVTLTQYIHAKRLDRSRELLRYSRLSISEISEQLMFSSQSHFSRLFKERFGRTPIQYRRLYGWKKVF